MEHDPASVDIASPPDTPLGSGIKGAHTITGDVRLHERFHSRFLPQDRTIAVYLPPGYDPTSRRRYPVLYLHDGQNLFDRATSFGEEWQVDETAQSLIACGEIDPLIVVGIYNTGDNRVDEYTPTRHPATERGGRAGDYGRMMVDELKPFIDRRYNTLPAGSHTAVGGSSLGGLLTLYLGLEYPDTFTRLAALSPSVWWDECVILRRVGALEGQLPVRIWLDAGTAEGQGTIENVRALRDALVAKGWTIGDDLAYVEASGGEHNEVSWAARFADVLKFLFPPGALSDAS
ncbi:MAG: alpha/beta hydrolase-fold protein [bacterium]